MVHVDEHLQVRKNMVRGPNGVEDASITVDDDLHVDKQEESMKNQKVGKHSHKRPNDAFHAELNFSSLKIEFDCVNKVVQFNLCSYVTA
ncbi:hypothetical protein R6Q57_022467 [Mikania cordata]